MKCRLVFYAARKTSLCERALQRSFSRLKLSLAGTSFVTDGGALCDELTKAFELYHLVFAVGGLGFNDKNGVKSVLEGALDGADVTECKKIENPDGCDGCLIRRGDRLLIVLPDEPAQIEAIMCGVTGKYIEKLFGN